VLYSVLEEIVEQHPNRTALVSGDTECSYSLLWTLSDQLADSLRQQGVVTGDRVAILSDNSIESVVAWWAVVKCNAICLNLNEKLKPSGFEYLIEDASPKLFLFGTAKMQELLPVSVDHLVLDEYEWDVKYEAATDSETQEKSQQNDDPDSIASIVYTSGSTGNPKGVCLTHANLLSVGNIAADGFALTENDRYLMVVPLHYIHGLMMMVSLQVRGASLEFMPNFIFPTAVTQRLADKEITGFSGVPFHFSALMDRGNFLNSDLPHLRWVCVTGGTFTPERIQQVNKHKPELEIHIAYGQTECSPRITMLDPTRVTSKPTSVGSVAPGLTIQFLDDEGNDVPDGQTGELVVAGANVMHGYWNDPENTAKVIDEQGRLHTGDLAYRDEDGDVFIRGRVQAMIKSAGERIFPEELEAILIKHPAVENVAVVGQTDALYGQIVEAHVVLQSECER